MLSQESRVVNRDTREDDWAPLAWWNEKCSRTADQPGNYLLVAPLASMIYTIPTSSASSKRSWSIHDFIHTKRRNRLDARRVEKLVFVYCNAGNKDAKDFYPNEDESESGDDDDDEEEDAPMGIDDDSEDASSESTDEFNDSNHFLYDGSEEQDFVF